ncbi:MAG: hypothetical protein E7178_03175 [Erysipelotrichaceae bacterium]|jgi:Na+-transporting methylmalonyl-CoA/oxaloacetate decarboxylase gamma subunit|nr:hypothetical protein [Erysipelotrichaceae bacterium]
MNKKKVLFICGISVDVAVTIFLFVLSIIMLANAGKSDVERQAMTGFVGWLVNLQPWVYGVAFVVPLFVLLAANVIGLVIYVRKSTKKEPVQVSDLSDEQKEALKKELLKDLNKDE